MDPYTVLGVPRDATETEIRAAYGRRALALQTSGVAVDPAERARLDAVLALLTDPERRAEYDRGLPMAPHAASEAAPDPASAASAAFAHARNGALWFAGGALLTAASFVGAAPGGRFTIAWGAVLFGALQLVRGLSAYMGAPPAGRTRGQVVALAVLISVGLVAGALVLVLQVRSSQADADLNEWNTAIDAAQIPVDQASVLFKEMQARTGPWSAQDSTDSSKISALYGQAADALAKAPAISDSVWYRDALIKNYQEAADIMAGYARLNEPATQTELDALDQRWTARLKDLQQIGDRLDAQHHK